MCLVGMPMTASRVTYSSCNQPRIVLLYFLRADKPASDPPKCLMSARQRTTSHLLALDATTRRYYYLPLCRAEDTAQVCLAREDIMRKLIRQLLTLLLLACAVWAQSKDFWEKKDYRQWTEKECRKLLDDSPWTDSYSISQIFFDRVVNDTTDRERQANPKIEYKVQIRSALPVRQAIIRLSQINAKYDRLSEEQRKGFDQNAEKFLARRDPDPIVMHVNYAATAQLDDRDLTRYWHSQTFDSLKNSTNLIGSKSARVPLSAFRQGAGEAH